MRSPKPAIFAVLFQLPLLAAPELLFNRDVRPILSDRCFNCHGPDAKNKNIPLRLDLEQAAKADLGNNRRAITAGDPGNSELIRRITAEKPARRMPPVATGHALTPKEIETLATWIAQGAKWQAHWSFIAPTRPDAPAVNNTVWPRNPIDRFILARLEREGLAPAPEASKETWLRRVTFDLTGLPPTLAEIDAFLADNSPEAHAKAADRLLASPRYGERMAAKWLDSARYADTNGYQFDGERQMWRWRDWVIAAFNRNQPYNEFALEQIAGDLLPNPSLDQRIATGFNRNHRGNTEDGIIAEEYAAEYVADRVETTSTVFLGLTIGCARCHNHKYDPFTQKEFYQLFAYFNNLPENGRAMKYGNSPPLIAAPTPEQQTKLDALNAAIAREEAFLAQHQSEIGSSKTPWIPRSALDFSWQPPAPNVTFPQIVGDPKTGFYDIRDHFTFAAKVHTPASPKFSGAILTKTGDSPQSKGYGIAFDDAKIFINITSTWETDAIKLRTKRTLEPNTTYSVALTYDGTVSAGGLNLYIDGVLEPVTIEQENLYRPFVNAGGTFKQPFRVGGGGGKANVFGGAITDLHAWGRVLTRDELTALANPTAKPEFARYAFLASPDAPVHLRDAFQRLENLRLERYQFERSLPTVMVMAEMPTRRQSHILLRGAYDKPGDPVEPGIPASLPSLPKDAPNNRLALAQWITSPANPLTARVAVNRLWQSFFGTGLVKTAEDFGSQGEWPSHPELLDWLATEFVSTGWNVKALQKQIVLSAAYRQSSRASSELIQRDPDNRLIARGPRFRLTAEMIRDAALANSGLLYEKLGGPSVKPYQPAGLWKETSMQDMEYIESKDRDLYRRSLYTFWKRTIAPPMMVNFDAANHESCTVRDNRTNTPLQALNLMNDVAFLEASRKIAERALIEAAPDAVARLTYIFRLVTSRKPTPAEVAVLQGNLNYHLDYFADAARAGEVLAQGQSPIDPKVQKRELAAYATVASLILNLDEAITKE